MSDDPRFKRLLEIRQALSKASTAKYKALLNGLGADDRIRSLLMYHGAGTGRWTAKRFQPQNLPSRGLTIGGEPLEDEDTSIALVEQAIAAAKLGMLGELHGDVMGSASACIRGMLIPAGGHRFICADFSAIEGRVLAWMAGETTVIDAYLAGLRMYCVAAAGIYHEPYEVINKLRKSDARYKLMDAIGKVIELACGYQGGVGAFNSMAANYGVTVPEAEAREAISAWRESRPMTVALWRGAEEAARGAVENPGALFTYRDLRFKVVGKFLLMRLPSNRLLYYFNPRMEPKEMPWKDDEGNPVVKECIAYDGMDTYTHEWSRQFTYGGSLVENAVQAAARDIMAQAMLRLDAAGYPIVLTVHDEVVADVPEGHGSVEDFERIMTIVPPWATGLPLAAEGWEGYRYRK